jgi:hypothetical protein
MTFANLTTEQKNALPVIVKASALGYGSDRYGPCECCGKHMTEAFYFTRSQEVKFDGMEPFTMEIGSTFAHRDCVEVSEQ